MFTKSIIAASIAALAGSASAAPVAASTSTGGTFSLIASHSGDTHIHLRTINASGQRFYIGRDTSTYCPIDDCSSYKNQTVIAASGSDSASSTASLSVVVPGGQQIYIDPSDGALAYTIAHSNSAPADAIRDGFVYTPATVSGSTGTFKHGTDGFFACPLSESNSYQIFVAVNENVATDGCIGLGAAAAAVDGPGAFQYA